MGSQSGGLGGVRAAGTDWQAALEKVKEESEGMNVANFTEQCMQERGCFWDGLFQCVEAEFGNFPLSVCA